MNIIEFKESIKNKSVDDIILIFKYQDNTFLVNQYINQIIKDKNMSLTYVDSLSTQSIFFDDTNYIIYKIDTFEDKNGLYVNNKNTIIVCKNIDKDTENVYSKNIIEFPKLEQWHILDYTINKLNGLDKKYIDWLCSIYDYDIFGIENEINKIRLFPKENQESIFKDLSNNDNFKGINNLKIFDVVNAFTKNDKKTLVNYCSDDEDKFNVFAIHSLLVKQFYYIVSVQLNNRIVAEDLNISFNQFKAIKNLCGYYSNERLIEIYEFLLTILNKIKNGYISQDNLLTYMINHICY